MLHAWMSTHRTRQWPKGLRFVASAKNRMIHRGIGRTPYEAVFGFPMRVGITSALPSGVLPEMATEEELEDFLRGIRVGASPARSPGLLTA